VIRFRKEISDELAELETEVLAVVSYRGCDKSPLTVGGIRQASPDVVLGQFRKVVEDLLMGLTNGEPTENVRDRNSHVADAGTATALAWLDGNDVLVIHGKQPSTIRGSVQQRFRHFNPG
jgi:hypothetical protein